MKILKNKRIMAVLALVLVLSIAAGTYAWFVISSEPDTNTIAIGELDMETTFSTNAPNGFQFEPGSEVKVTSGIKNTGSLMMLTKLDIASESRLVRDEDGIRYSNPNYTRVIENDENVVAVLDESQLGWGVMPDGSVFAWLYNEDVEGEYYLSLQQGAGFDLEYVVKLDGPAMTNEYMNGTVVFESQWVATQNLMDAIEHKFDVDFEKLQMVPNYIVKGAGRARTASITMEEVYERLFGIPYNK